MNAYRVFPDEEPPKLVMAVTYRKLLEVTHFHLFTLPVFLLIIAHLFMLTVYPMIAMWMPRPDGKRAPADSED